MADLEYGDDPSEMLEHGRGGRHLPGTVIGKWGTEWALLEVPGVGVVSAPLPEWAERLDVGVSVVVELGPGDEVTGLSPTGNETAG